MRKLSLPGFGPGLIAFTTIATVWMGALGAAPLDVEKAKEILAGRQGWVDGTPLLRQARTTRGLEPLLEGLSSGYTPSPRKILAAPTQKEFWIIDLTDFGTPAFDPAEDKYLLPATLRATTSSAYLYIDDTVTLGQALIDELMLKWENDIYPSVTDIWGSPPDELDGDPRVYLLIAQFREPTLPTGTVVGFFDDTNQLTDPEALSIGAGHSNEIEMLYINSDAVYIDPGTGKITQVLFDILAHEFQHVIHWGLDRDEDLWLNEAHSEAAMIASGTSEVLQQHTASFAVIPTTGLVDWDNRLEDYGAAITFMIYLTEHYGGDAALTAIAGDSINGVTSVDTYLRLNYGTNIRKVFRDWTIANLLDEATGPYSYQSPDNPRAWVELMDDIGFPQPYFFTWRDVPFDQPDPPALPYLEDWAAEYFLLDRAPGEAGLPFHVAFDAEDGRPFYPSVIGIEAAAMQATAYSQFVLDNGYAGDFNIPLAEERVCVILRHASADLVEFATGTADYDLRVLPGSGTGITDPIPPAAVTDLTIERLDGTRIDLAWTAPGDDGSAGIAYYYDIRASTSAPINDGNWALALPVRNVPLPGISLGTDRCVLTQLLPDRDYWFAMKTYDEVDNESLLSNVAWARTGLPDETPPAVITDLVAVEITGGSITFRWTAPGDDGDAGAAERYEIRYAPFPINSSNYRSAFIYVNSPQPSPGGAVQQLSVPTDIVAPTHLLAIRAFDEAGNAADWSNPAGGTLPTGVDSWGLLYR